MSKACWKCYHWFWGLFALAQLSVALGQPLGAGADVTISLGEPQPSRTIQPLVGVNAGPTPSGEPGNADVTSAYRAAGVQAVRTHDFYGPLDMAVLYPDRTKDPALVASYNFISSDAVFAAIAAGGFEPYFRLGDSYNNVRPPADSTERDNWIQAAVRVIRHYREGKWDGFHNQFRYLEIWNEPDNTQFWPPPHTRDEFFQFFAAVTATIKTAFPDLKVGGPALTPAGFLAPQGRNYTDGFLHYLRDHAVSLDFFSWHMYSNDPADFENAAAYYRSRLDEHGFAGAENHISEWNTESGGAEAVALRTGAKGAAILSAAWIGLQDQRVDFSTFYRGTDTSPNLPTFYGMFYADGRPKKIALAFTLWSMLAGFPTAAEATITTAGAADAAQVRALVGVDGRGSAALLVVNPTAIPLTVTVDNPYTGGGAAACKRINTVTDQNSQIEQFLNSTAVLDLPAYAVVLIQTDYIQQAGDLREVLAGNALFLNQSSGDRNSDGKTDAVDLLLMANRGGFRRTAARRTGDITGEGKHR